MATNTAPTAPTDNTERPPVLAEGVEMIGEYEGSGFKEPPSLVRRSDGQVIQLPPLLYSVAHKADGQSTYGQIAEKVSTEIRRGVDADSVRFLVEEKLRPLGILAAADGTSPELPKPDPFLGLKLKAAVVPEWLSAKLGSTFKFLFLPPLVLGVLAGAVAVDWWLFGSHGVAQGLRESIYNPTIFLLIFLGIVASAAFHEVGHAAGCRYGGGMPGKMGCGLYLAWPAFYTDVTDAYRLGRRGRLRTDLGGVYFNLVVVLITTGLYLATRFEPLLLLVVFQHLEIAHQLLPVVRLDGYYIVADATGVPDMFSRIGPILRGMLPGRKPDERVTALKRWVRVAVTVWVLVVVPLLLFELFIVLLHLPRILGTAWDSASQTLSDAREAFGGGNILGAVGAVLQLLMLSVPIVGILLMLVKSAIAAGRGLWRRTEGRPVRRAVGTAAVGALTAMLVFSWISPDNYEPIRPDEKGTLISSVRAVRTPSRLAEPPLVDETAAAEEEQDQPEEEDVVLDEEETPTSSDDRPTTTLGGRVTPTTVARPAVTTTSSVPNGVGFTPPLNPPTTVAEHTEGSP